MVETDAENVAGAGCDAGNVGWAVWGLLNSPLNGFEVAGADAPLLNIPVNGFSMRHWKADVDAFGFCPFKREAMPTALS